MCLIVKSHALTWFVAAEFAVPFARLRAAAEHGQCCGPDVSPPEHALASGVRTSQEVAPKKRTEVKRKGAEAVFSKGWRDAFGLR